MKVREVTKLIEQDGWQWARTKGGHRLYKHPGKPSEVLAPGTLNSILKQAGLKE